MYILKKLAERRKVQEEQAAAAASAAALAAAAATEESVKPNFYPQPDAMSKFRFGNQDQNQG